MTRGSAAAPHLHPTTSQQNSQELPPNPALAQLLQQLPRPPHRKLPPSYPAAYSPHFSSVPSLSYRRAGGCTPDADYAPQQCSLQAKSEMGMLQLLANSDPVLTADELLARLRSAATAEAPAHYGGIQGHQCTANKHEAASTGLNQSVLQTGKFCIELHYCIFPQAPILWCQRLDACSHARQVQLTAASCITDHV